ncbi:MAG TPA: hypothetical protein VF414_05625 [Thermoanaerobaculia bacterium]
MAFTQGDQHISIITPLGRPGQYRACFRWKEGHADDVEITDYH